MQQELEKIKEEALTEIGKISDERALEDTRIHFLGKKGRLTRVATKIKEIPPEKKPLIGKLLHETRQTITEGLEAKKEGLILQKDTEAAAGIDVTLPGIPSPQGALHPITQIIDRSLHILRHMGFSLAEGPEVDSEWYNFDALNTPKEHPARNEKDTFYFENGLLLRTHTSTVQIRTMEDQAPPIRIIAPGSAYRRDEIDATHLSNFNQIEGLYVDKEVTIGDLKGTLEFFFKSLFGEKTEMRIRPHFFPFTEPSYEVDIKLETGNQESKWLEMGGCGMVDPAVFEAICAKRGDDHYHPDKVTGFAFGLGPDRCAMILGNIPDIRFLIENDYRFLNQFRETL